MGMKKIAILNSHIFDLIFIFPPALGDSMMTTQAIRRYETAILSKNVLIICNNIYLTLFRDIFPRYSCVSFEEVLDIFHNQKIYSEDIIDFRSDQVSNDLLKYFDYFKSVKFIFGSSRKILVHENGKTPEIHSSIMIKDYPNDDGITLPAWHLDAELIVKGLRKKGQDFDFFFKHKLEYFNLTKRSAYKSGYIGQVNVFPCGNNSNKKWPEAYWIVLIQMLIDNEISVTVFLGPNESNIYERFSKITETYISLDWSKIISRIDSNSCVVGNDCGPMHVCGILGLKLLALYGPSNPIVWFTYDERGKYISSDKNVWPNPSKVYGEVISILNLRDVHE